MTLCALWQSVLAMAGGLKRQRGHAAEAGLLVEALMNANLPKLLAGDAALFNALLKDLFPQTTHAQQVSQQSLKTIHLRALLCLVPLA